MKRRTFLAGSGLVAGGLLLGGCTEDSPAVNGARQDFARDPEAPDFWQRVRSQFTLSPDWVHLSALLVSSNPLSVRQAIASYRNAIDADPVTYLEAQNNRRKEDVRAAAASYLGGNPDHIALTDSTTMGIALVYHGLALQPGQEVLTTAHDYYATHESLRQVATRRRATVREIALFDQAQGASSDEIVGRLIDAVTPRTRALALTWVHSSTGLKLPMAEIRRAVDDLNQTRDEEDRLLVCLDGVHGFGVEDMTAEELGCNFFMAGCHKWLFGPRGTGIVWARPADWALLQPLIPSFIDDASWNAWAGEVQPPGPTTAARMSPGGFKPFEHQWAVKEAFEFHQQIGKSRIAERTHALNRRLKEQIEEMPHVHLVTPLSDERSAGIVCFDVDGMSPGAVVDRFAREHIVATTTPYARSYPRLTPSIYNTEAEVDHAAEVLRSLA